MTAQEIAIGKEYLAVMEPVAISLDILQGEHNCYLRCVPVLVKLRRNLSKLSCLLSGEFRDYFVKRIDERFSDCFKEDNYVFVASLHPIFKFLWIVDEEHKQEARGKIQNYLGGLNLCSTDEISRVTDDYLNFDSSSSDQPISEFDSFIFDKRKHFNMLDDFPDVKALFVKFNTFIPF